jgi:hypothetical protein
VTFGEPEKCSPFSGTAFARMAGLDLKAPTVGPKVNRLRLRPVYLDMADIPAETRFAIYEQRHETCRLTRNGWDRFLIGDFEIVSLRMADIVSQIKSACLARGLLWRFEIRRVQNPNDPEDRSAWYLVSRLR